ncbi:MAG: hypothetical protein PSV22_11940 [Pseudolabrys sp.]|nr:hypothetical protein [Pseudolabrys sp.]
MTEAEMIAMLKPCLYGPYSGAAIGLLLSGDVNQFPRVRALAELVLQAHSEPSSLQKDQRKGELIFRWQEAKKSASDRGCDFDFVEAALREEFADLTDDDFAYIIGGKAGGRFYRIANQFRVRSHLPSTLTEDSDSHPKPI